MKIKNYFKLLLFIIMLLVPFISVHITKYLEKFGYFFVYISIFQISFVFSVYLVCCIIYYELLKK